MKILNKLTFFLLLGLIPFNTIAQQEIFEEFENELEQYKEENPQEKFYLHTSQSQYFTGDVLWYKLYQVNADSGIPQSLSKVVYVDLVDESNHQVILQKVFTKEGLGNGEFIIPDTLSSGSYYLRAYSNWMKNFEPEWSFSKPVAIYNPDQTLSKDKDPDDHSIDLQFFPEGGQLVEGITSNVAFKAINGAGKGINIQGEIIDDLEKTILTFASQNFNKTKEVNCPRGMGKFNFKPENGKNYFAKIMMADSTIKLFPILKALNNGSVLKVTSHTKEKIDLEINNSEQQNTQQFVIGQMHGQLVFREKVDIKNGLASLAIPTKELSSGILQITLFNSLNYPICERLVFIRNNENYEIQIIPNKTEFHNRENVVLNVAVKDKYNQPLSANLSLGVIKDNLLAPASADGLNINSYLLLQSEIKGKIEYPNYYFEGNDSEKSEMIDLLMLTQGWRRFSWNKVLSEDNTKFDFTLERDLTISGYLKSGNNPLEFKSMAISSIGVPPIFERGFTETKGYFYFKELDFFGSRELNFQTNTEGLDGKIHFDLESPSLPFKKSINDFSNQKPLDVESLKRAQMRNQINKSFHIPRFTIVAKETKSEKKREKFNEPSPAHYPADDVKWMANYNNFFNMTDVIREILHNVKLQQKKGEYFLKIYDRDSKVHENGAPTYLIDGIIVEDKNEILNFEIKNVASAEVMRSTATVSLFGHYGTAGILAIYTKDNDYFAKNKNGLEKITVEGYHQAREFYSPKYGSGENENIPDFRQLLYWAPNIKTDENGKASITFFTGDESGNFQIQAEGLSNNGIPLVESATIKVTNKDN